MGVPIHLLVAVSGVVVVVDVDVVVNGPVVPVAKIINKIPTAHVLCSPISPFTLTLIPPLSIPCFLFYLAHPPLPYSSLFPTVSRLPLPKIIKIKISSHTCADLHTQPSTCSPTRPLHPSSVSSIAHPSPSLLFPTIRCRSLSSPSH